MERNLVLRCCQGHVPVWTPTDITLGGGCGECDDGANDGDADDVVLKEHLGSCWKVFELEVHVLFTR